MTRAYLLVRHRRGERTSDEPPAPCALSPAASYVDSCHASTPSPPHHTLHIIQVPCLLSCLMHARPCKARRCSRAARGQWCDEQERGPIMGRISSAPTQKDPCFQQLSSPMHFKPLCSSMCLKRATKNKPQPHTLPLQHAHRPRSTRPLPRSAQGRQIDRWCELGLGRAPDKKVVFSTRLAFTYTVRSNSSRIDACGVCQDRTTRYWSWIASKMSP